MCVMRHSPMVAQHRDMLSERFIVGYYRAGFAPCAEVLPRIEAEASGTAEGSGPAPSGLGSNPCAVGLARIFDQMQLVIVGQFPQFDDRRRQPKQVNRKYRLGSLGRAESARREVGSNR